MRRRLLPTLALLALGVAACSGELSIRDDDLGGGGGAGGGGGRAGDMVQARAIWASDVQPLMVAARPKGACVACHQGAITTGPAFLGASQEANFDTLIGGFLVGATPAASLFMTFGEHTGNGFCTGVGLPYVGCLADETAIVSNWILVLNGP